MITLSKKMITAFYAALIATGFLVLNSTSVKAAERSTNFSKLQNKQASPAIPVSANTIEENAKTDTAVVISPEEEAMVRLLNQDRAKAGLPLLEIDLTLVKLAKEKSGDMVANNYFGHISKRLGTIYEQLVAEGIPCTAVAENLVGAPNIGKAHLYVMRSSIHRGNVLNPSFKKIGIGIVRGGPHGKMMTQIFLSE